MPHQVTLYLKITFSQTNIMYCITSSSYSFILHQQMCTRCSSDDPLQPCEHHLCHFTHITACGCSTIDCLPLVLVTSWKMSPTLPFSPKGSTTLTLEIAICSKKKKQKVRKWSLQLFRFSRHGPIGMVQSAWFSHIGPVGEVQSDPVGEV